MDTNKDLPVWKLTDLYLSLDDPAIASDLESIAQDVKRLEGARGTLAEMVSGGASGAESLAELLLCLESLTGRMHKIASFAFLHFAGDCMDEAIVKFRSQMEEKLTLFSNALVFLQLELNALDEEALKQALGSSAELKRFSPFLRDLRFEKPYQLEERVEQAFGEKAVTGIMAWTRLFDQTMASLDFVVEGKPGTLKLEAVLDLLTSPQPSERKAGSESLSQTLRAHEKVFTFILNTVAKDSEINRRWRGAKDLAGLRHLSNRIDGAIVEALTDAVSRREARLSHRYYKLKAKWMGLPKLKHWDRNAPLQQKQTKIPWNSAKEIVLNAYNSFNPQFGAIAQDFFDKNWIDAPSRSGKMSGAFSASTSPDAHPYILLNYLGKSRDVMTLAHELGHGVHQVLSAKQGALMQDVPLTLAETASVFGEMLTFRSLLNQSNDTDKRFLIARKVEDMIATVSRQIAFYRFERAVHEARRGGELSSEDIGRIWIETQAESLGEHVSLEPGYEVFWSYIPHFIHSPFYVYAYAFGDGLVNALYAVYEAGDAGDKKRFARDYMNLLSAGGTLTHEEALAPFGLDPHDPAFWDKGLGVTATLIDELEAMDAAE